MWIYCTYWWFMARSNGFGVCDGGLCDGLHIWTSAVPRHAAHVAHVAQLASGAPHKDPSFDTRGDTWDLHSSLQFPFSIEKGRWINDMKDSTNQTLGPLGVSDRTHYYSRTDTVLGRSGGVLIFAWNLSALIIPHGKRKGLPQVLQLFCASTDEQIRTLGADILRALPVRCPKKLAGRIAETPPLGLQCISNSVTLGKFPASQLLIYICQQRHVTSSTRWQNVASSVQLQLCPVKFESCGGGETSVLCCLIHILTWISATNKGTLSTSKYNSSKFKLCLPQIHQVCSDHWPFCHLFSLKSVLRPLPEEALAVV